MMAAAAPSAFEPEPEPFFIPDVAPTVMMPPPAEPVTEPEPEPEPEIKEDRSRSP